MAAAPDDESVATPALISAFAHGLVDDPRRAKVTFGPSRAVSPAVELERRANRRWAAGFYESILRRYGVTTAQTDVHHVAVGVIGGMFDLVSDWILDADPADPEDVQTLITRLTAFYLVTRRGLEA